MLPSLAGLCIDDLQPTGPEAGLETPIAKKRKPRGPKPPGEKKPTKEKDTNVVWFKAFDGPYRLLSNLFGSVEWEFQIVKFRKGCGVHEFMKQGLQWHMEGTWEYSEGGNFDMVRKRMDHTGQLKSYVKGDNVASGLIAKLVSAIAKPKLGEVAKKRLKYILSAHGTPDEQKMDPEVWRSTYVMPVMTVEKADAHMYDCLKNKYTNSEYPRYQEYKQLLLCTGTKMLHEKACRGNPSAWEWYPMKEEQKEKHRQRGYEPYQGDDRLGKLLRLLRTEISAQPGTDVVGCPEPPPESADSMAVDEEAEGRCELEPEPEPEPEAKPGGM